LHLQQQYNEKVTFPEISRLHIGAPFATIWLGQFKNKIISGCIKNNCLELPENLGALPLKAFL
jgi:hypothetical protein